MLGGGGAGEKDLLEMGGVWKGVGVWKERRGEGWWSETSRPGAGTVGSRWMWSKTDEGRVDEV